MYLEGRRKINEVIAPVAEQLGSEYFVHPAPAEGEDVPLVQIRFWDRPKVREEGYSLVSEALKEAGLHDDPENPEQAGGEDPKLMPNGTIQFAGRITFEYIDMNVRGTEIARSMQTC